MGWWLRGTFPARRFLPLPTFVRRGAKKKPPSSPGFAGCEAGISVARYGPIRQRHGCRGGLEISAVLVDQLAAHRGRCLIELLPDLLNGGSTIGAFLASNDRVGSSFFLQ